MFNLKEKGVHKYSVAIDLIGWPLVAFIIPFWQKGLPPILIGLAALAVILSFLSKDWRQIDPSSREFKIIFFAFVLFYLWHVAGLFWTENFKYAVSDLTQKSALVFLPFYFLWRGRQKSLTIDFVILGFIFGNVVAGLYNVGYAVSESLSSGWSIQFFLENELSRLMHKTYFSLYLNFAWFGALFLIERRSNHLDRRIIIFLKIFVPFAWILILLLGSRIGILTCLFIGGLILVRALLNIKKSQKLIWLTSFSIIATTLGVYFLPSINNDFRAMYDKTLVENIDIKERESTTARILVLKSSLELIKDNYLIGVGTGDVKDKLISHYSEKGYSGLTTTKLNAHNQFLQAFIALGILGCSFLLLSIILMLKTSITEKNELLFCFAIIMFFCFMTESALEVQTGISFFTFWGSILLLSIPENYFIESKSERILFGLGDTRLHQ